MPPPKNRVPPGEIVGKTFGWLKVLRQVEFRYTERFECSCRCGQTAVLSGTALTTGKKKSCGCRVGNRSHGLSLDRTWNIWRGMITRCHSPTTKNKHYQQRGIVVCKRWRDSYEAFLRDMGRAPNGATLDRIDNNGDYEPMNCRWATMRDQARNKSTNVWVIIDGRRMLLSDAAAEMGCSRGMVSYYVKKGLVETD